MTVAATWLLVFAVVLVVAAFVRPGKTSAPPPHGQLLWNGGFERGLSYWDAAAGSTLRLIRPGRTGRQAALVSGPGLGVFGVHYARVVSAPALGQRYSIVAWVKPRLWSAGEVVHAQLVEVRPPKTHVMAASSAPVRAGWQCISASGVVTAPNARQIDAYVVFPQNLREGDSAVVDDVLATRGRARCPFRAPAP